MVSDVFSTYLLLTVFLKVQYLQSSSCTFKWTEAF